MRKKFILSLFLLLFTIILPIRVTFLFSADDAEKVEFISDFNNFIPDDMEKTFTGLWRYIADLEEGIYKYKFIVDGEKTIDFNNRNITLSDGQIYNTRLVESLYFPRKGDGKIKTITHQLNRRYVNPVKRGEIYISIEFEKNDVEDVILHSNGIILNKEHIITSNTELYRFHLKTPADIFKYKFEIIDGKSIIYGYSSSHEFFEFDFNRPSIKLFDIPEWTKGITQYQIFPERFKNGDTSNDPLFSNNWNGPHDLNSLLFGFYGGDLQGVIDSSDYLYTLGIESIYFNPIFKASTSHKYNTEDYFQIDPHFGTEETFDNLLKTFHDKNIKIILDGVFNHTGTNFFAMKENFEKQKESRYLDWYEILSFPIRESPQSYSSWHNYASLPKLNNDNPEVKAYISKIIAYWTAKGIDGWRLDAVDQLPTRYWSNFIYPNIKSINEEVTIIGEYWIDSTHYFEDPSFDSVMNYIFRDAIIAYARGGRSLPFVNATNNYIQKYPPQVLHGLWNILGSHDTARILTVLEEDVEKLKLAVAIQMTFIGSPMIYYGDEIGMTGNNDPFCRIPFYWDENMWNREIYDFYKTLTNFRKESDALKKGSYNVLSNNGWILAYERKYEDEKIIVISNSRNSKEIFNFELDENYVDILTGKTYEKIENLEPQEILILSNSHKKY